MRLVITGGPNCGKTSLVNALELRGYQIVPEAAQLAIEDMKDDGSWQPGNMACLQELQHRIIVKQLELEERIDENHTPIFFDRSAADNLAYCGLYGLDVPASVREYISSRARFDKVYFLDRIAAFEKNGIRYEDEETALKVDRAIESTYSNLGYWVTRVPLFGGPKEESIRKRAEFILKDVHKTEVTHYAYASAAVPA